MAVVPHPHVVDKNREGHLGSKRFQPRGRPHSPGLRHQEDKSPECLAVKTNGGWGGGRQGQIFRILHLKGQLGLTTYEDTPLLGFSTRATAGRAPVA